MLEAKFADDSLSNFWTNDLNNSLKSTTWGSKWNRKKYFVGCYSSWLKDGIYGVTNVGVEILMHIQINEQNETRNLMKLTKTIS